MRNKYSEDEEITLNLSSKENFIEIFLRILREGVKIVGELHFPPI